MTETTITAADIVAKVREVAAREPHRYYRVPLGGERYYVYDDQPSSLEGMALWELGLIDATIQRRFMNELSIRDLIISLGLKADEADVNWLRWCQHYGDHLDPWATAVEKADQNTALGLQYGLAS